MVSEFVWIVLWSLTPEAACASVSTHCSLSAVTVERVSAVPSAFVPRYLRLGGAAPSLAPMVTYEP